MNAIAAMGRKPAVSLCSSAYPVIIEQRRIQAWIDLGMKQ